MPFQLVSKAEEEASANRGERTKVPREVLSRYELTIDEVMSFKYYGQELGMLEAISLAFDFGLCKGYQAGKI